MTLVQTTRVAPSRVFAREDITTWHIPQPPGITSTQPPDAAPSASTNYAAIGGAVGAVVALIAAGVLAYYYGGLRRARHRLLYQASAEPTSAPPAPINDPLPASEYIALHEAAIVDPWSPPTVTQPSYTGKRGAAVAQPPHFHMEWHTKRPSSSPAASGLLEASGSGPARDSGSDNSHASLVRSPSASRSEATMPPAYSDVGFRTPRPEWNAPR